MGKAKGGKEEGETDVYLSPEAIKVLDWRQQQLEEAGYPIELAIALANNTDVDVRRAVTLLKRGCPARVAAQILD